MSSTQPRLMWTVAAVLLGLLIAAVSLLPAFISGA